MLPCVIATASLPTGAEQWLAGVSSLAGASLPLTVCAVLWEELWFRGPVLNLVAPGRPAVVFAACNGLLFAALHLLNPRFDPFVEGPELLAAGALLTLAYIASGSFYVPFALHLGNNVTAQILRNAAGPEGAAALESPAATHCRAVVLAAGVAAASWWAIWTPRASSSPAPRA